MPKIRRDVLPAHIIVPDTNILWDKDKKNSVSSDFNTFWEKNKSLISIKLIVPEVVLGELQFQQATSAMKLASTVAENLEELSGVAQATYSTRFDNDKIKKQVGAKLNKWVKSLGGSVEKTPVEKIDWSKMVQCSIWRIEPFTFDPKNKDNEKGFRDALILETLLNICSTSQTNENIVFLCNDFLLRTTAEKLLSHNSKVLIFESLADFEAYIKLTQEKLTDKFVKSIQNHARSKFFLADDQTCIYYKEKIRQEIVECFKTELQLPPSYTTNTGGLLSIPTTVNWKTIDEKWWINATRFNKLASPKEYHWISRVTLVRLIKTEAATANVFASTIPRQELLQTFAFDISWKANVKMDGRFHDIAVLNIKSDETTSDTPSEELLVRWKLQQNGG